jgi:hypothetical protein
VIDFAVRLTILAPNSQTGLACFLEGFEIASRNSQLIINIPSIA